MKRHQPMTFRSFRWIALPLAGGMLVSWLIAGQSALADRAGDQRVEEENRALAAGTPEHSEVYDAILAHLTLPPGENAADSIGDDIWKRSEPLNEDLMQSIVEWTARCDWYIYVLREEGMAFSRESVTRELRAIADWPSMKADGWSASALRIASDIEQGNFDSLEQEFRNGNCIDPTGQIKSPFG